MYLCLIFVFIFAHMEKAAHIVFLVEQGKAKQIICNPQMCQIKCVALLLFDSSIFENRQPWSWGYNWERATTSNILRLVGCTRKHISNIRSCSCCQIFLIFRLHQNVSTLAELMKHTQWHPSNRIRNTEVASVYKVLQFSRK